MKLKSKVFWLLVLMISITEIASGQCCSAGNPFISSEYGNLGHKILQVNLNYKYSKSNKYYSGSEQESISYIDQAFFNFMNLQVIYGLLPRLSLQSDIGYFFNKTQEYVNPDLKTSRGYGIGDATFSIKYLLYKNWTRNLEITPSLGVVVPVGVFDQEADHVKLPLTVQPSSGSFRYFANVFLSKKIKYSAFRISSFASFEYSQLINSENFYYKYGNLYLFSLMGSWSVNKWFALALEARSENKGRAIRENDQVVESSGYNLIYAVPYISFAARGVLLSINAEIPVYRYYNGIQLSNTLGVSCRLAYNIDFTRKANPAVEEIILE